MNTEERLVSYQVNECLKQRDELREQLETARQAHSGTIADKEEAEGRAAKSEIRAEAAEAEVERLRAVTVNDPACSDPMCSYRAEALTRGAMPTLTPEEAKELLGALPPLSDSLWAKLSLIANGEKP